MPRVGFEPTIPVFQGAKTVHALDCATHCSAMLTLGINVNIIFVLSFVAVQFKRGNHSLSLPKR
jgi:hypothetical protein